MQSLNRRDKRAARRNERSFRRRQAIFHRSAALVGSSHGGQLSIDFTLAHPEIVQQPVLVGGGCSGIRYSPHFLDSGRHVFELLEKGDIQAAISEWSKNKYLIAPGNDAARKRLFDLLSANPQDMSHTEHALPAKPALPRLPEIQVPTMLLVVDADIPDVHAHAVRLKLAFPTRIVRSWWESATSCIWKNQRNSASA